MDELRILMEEAADRVEPSPDLFERLERGHRRRQRTRRIAVGLGALAIAAAGLSVPILVLGGGSPHVPGPAGSHAPTFPTVGATEYTMQMPDTATPTDQKGHYTLHITTNLPPGTVVDVENESGGGSAIVGDGALDLPFLNNQCVGHGGVQVSPPTTMTVTVAPSYDAWTHGPPSATPRSWQPASVQAILGTNFEDLAGPQVTFDSSLGFNLLVVSHAYQLPNQTCIPNRP
jgi:hypothetical protein